MESVVRDHTFPDEIPQRIDDVVGEAADDRVNLSEERGAVRREVVDERMIGNLRWAVQQRQMIRQIKRHAAVAITQRLHSDPNDLPGGAEHVEVRRSILIDARGENLAFEN